MKTGDKGEANRDLGFYNTPVPYCTLSICSVYAIHVLVPLTRSAGYACAYGDRSKIRYYVNDARGRFRRQRSWT